MVADDYGSHFGTCTCGVPKVDGIPCLHMVAICKSNRIEGLNENNIMPFWYHTSHWRKQYPEGTSVDSSHITMLQLKENYEASKELAPDSVSQGRVGDQVLTRGIRVVWK